VATPARLALPDLPRVPLLDGPTPLHRLPRLEAALDGRTEIWIKREDLGPLAFSGNKLRNLEFLLGAAVAEGADAVVTSGRRWSNHCRLATAAGSRLGLAVHLVISGPRLPSPNLTLIELLGGIIHQAATDDRDEHERLVAEARDDLERAGHTVSVIPVGGSSAVGAWGQVLGALELRRQMETRGLSPDAIVLATATGGTQAGLLVGALRGFPRPPRVIGIVASQGTAALREVIEPRLRELGTMAGVDVPPDRIELDDRQLGPGYGKPTPASRAATELLARTEGILVDPVYTAKALAGLIDLVRSGGLSGRTAVLWNGGGLPSLFEAAPPAT